MFCFFFFVDRNQNTTAIQQKNEQIHKTTRDDIFSREDETLYVLRYFVQT